MIELDRWLTQATRHLARDSAAQVRGEIQEHFELSREAAMAGGATSDEADRSALHALGDAKTANRQYRQVLLTAAEARTLRDGNREAQAVCSRAWLKWVIFAVFPAALVVAAGLFFSGRGSAGRDVLTAAIGICPLAAALLLPIRTAAWGRFFRVVKWVALVGAVALIYGPETIKWSWLLISCLWPLALSEWRRASIRRKLPVTSWPRHLYL